MTDTDATERVEPQSAAQDPGLSPVVDHSAVTMHSPAPKVIAHRTPEPDRIDRVERGPRGVKLAKISKTGDRVFRSLASSSGLIMVLLVLFVGIFLLALALPSLRADQDNFLTSRNWTVAGNELASGSQECSGRRCCLRSWQWRSPFRSPLAWRSVSPSTCTSELRALSLSCRPARRRTVNHLRPLGTERPGAVPGPWGRVADQQDRLDSAVQQKRRSQGFGVRRLRGACHDDLADRDGDLARYLRADPARSDRGGTRPWRHPLGGDPNRGAAPWAVWCDQRIHARTWARARRDDCRDDHPDNTRWWWPFTPSIFAGGEIFASKIANNASEFDSPSKTGAYIAAGLVLFVVTFVVNAMAR